MEPLSVLIPTLNEQENLAACLESCAFADEVVVVDSGSVDATREIARAAGARVLTHGFEGHARQKNWGLGQVAHAWVLVLDADERVTPGLRREVESVLASTTRSDGYWIFRRNTFLGREIHGCGWQHDRVLRLFDHRKGRYEDRLVHEEVRVDGAIGSLSEHLVHHSCRNLADWMAKTAGYAKLGAEEAHRRGRGAGWSDLLLRPPARFVKQYFAQAGYRDGAEGFVLCTVSAFSVFLKYAMLRELRR